MTTENVLATPLKILSYYGHWMVDRETGAVLSVQIDEPDDENAWLQGITRFDVADHRAWCDRSSLPAPASADILVMGYWIGDHYEPGEDDYRSEVLQALRHAA